MLRVLTLPLAWALACGGPGQPAAGGDPFEDIPADHPLVGYEAWFLLTWQGERAGDAHERLRRDAGGGFRFTRTERVAIARGDALVRIRTELRIDVDDELGAERIRIDQRSGRAHTVGVAARAADGRWRVQYQDEPVRHVDGRAVPIELVPLLQAVDPGGFDGPVLLPGHGFATAQLGLARIGAERLRARLRTDFGVADSTVLLRPDGTVDRVEGRTGAIRVPRARVDEPYTAIEVVEDTGIAVSGPPPPVTRVRLVVAPVARPEPPPLPGQRLRTEGRTWRLLLDAGIRPEVPPGLEVEPPSPAMARLARRAITDAAPDNPLEELQALAHAADELLDDSLADPTTDARAALALGSGDCTAHALLFSELAAARGIPTRLVTGYRIDGGRLVRHRWVAARFPLGDTDRWIAVDPTYGEAPAASRLFGLAMHGTAAHELSLADELTFAGLEGAAARVER